MLGKTACVTAMMVTALASSALAADSKRTRAHEEIHRTAMEARLRQTLRSLLDALGPSDAARLEKIAEIRFQIAEIGFERFVAIQLKGSPKKVQRILTEKLQLIKGLSQQYSEIVELKITRWSLCAEARIGDLWHEAASTLAGAPMPPLSEEARDIYQTTVDDYVAKFEAQAVHYWFKAYRRSLKLGLDNECMKRTHAHLSRYRPAVVAPKTAPPPSP